MVHVIDLNFQGHAGTIAAFLVETSAGPVLVESGPATTLPALEAGVQALGYRLADIQHLLLTHIHFDHAGAAWRLADGGTTVHVHPVGVEHLADPVVLWKSAARIFGDAMERLWGEMRPIAAPQIHACADTERLAIGDTVFTAHHTPGHAKHHIAWQLGPDLFTGDVAGVCLNGGPVLPPCPPPDIDLEAWRRSIDRLRESAASQLYLTHFGLITEIAPHLAALERGLEDCCRWMEARLDKLPTTELIPAFERRVQDWLGEKGVTAETMADYEIANPAFMSVAGLTRYLRRKKT